MKHIILLIFLFNGFYSFSQKIDTMQILNNALISGEKMMNSIQNNDYDTFLTFTHPKIIEMSGGKEEMKKMLIKSSNSSVKIISTELSLPTELIIQDSLYQCVFYQKQLMKYNTQTFQIQGSLIGISYNFANTWFFINASNTLSDLQEYFPELSDDLIIIKQSDPIPVD